HAMVEARERHETAGDRPAQEQARLALDRVRAVATYRAALAEYARLPLEGPAIERERQLDRLFARDAADHRLVDESTALDDEHWVLVESP
ncbi:hypothetical protein, partial [Escherichia coli]